MEAEGDAAATWVSTVGENAAAGAVAASSGFAGASFEATTGGCVTAAGDSAARELVASILRHDYLPQIARGQKVSANGFFANDS